MGAVTLDAAIFNPATVFQKPEEILQDTKITLTKEQKIRALETWRYDVQLRLMAEAENMHSNQDISDDQLEQNILAALNKLKGA